MNYLSPKGKNYNTKIVTQNNYNSLDVYKRQHLGHLAQGLLPRAGGVDLHLVGGQQALADLQVQGLVIHHQDHGLGGGEGVAVLVVLPLFSLPVGAAGGGVDDLLGCLLYTSRCV